MGNAVCRHEKGRPGGNLIAQSQEVVGGYYFDLRFDRADPASVLADLLEEGLERTLLAVRATLDDVLTLLRAIALTSFLLGWMAKLERTTDGEQGAVRGIPLTTAL